MSPKGGTHLGPMYGSLWLANNTLPTSPFITTSLYFRIAFLRLMVSELLNNLEVRHWRLSRAGLFKREEIYMHTSK